eukprot:m.52050 g.52050  ORF g.52050 m.52050 type:complete len:455 (+) comp13035_c0_seq1:52-1416(+)
MMEPSLAGKDRAPSVFDEADSVRSRKPKWELIADVSIVTAAELNLLKAFDQNANKVIETDGLKLASILMKILQNVANPESKRYVITILADMINVSESRASLLIESAKAENMIVSEPFFKLLGKKEDPYLMHQASRIMSSLVMAGDKLGGNMKKYFVWLRNIIGRMELDTPEVSLLCIQRVLSRSENRLLLFQEGLDACLIPLTWENRIQAQYQAILCLWMTSFDPIVASNMENTHHVVAKVAAVLKTARKEKLARVCIALFRNLVQKPEDSNVAQDHLSVMVGAKVLPVINNIVEQKMFADEELMDDAKFLLGRLQERFEKMSSFDEYSSEVMTGPLEWSPVHKSIRFWKENVTRFNDDNYKLLRMLVEYLKSKQSSSECIAVAIHDLGEYARHYPAGKRALDSLQAKICVTGLIEHEDSAVRYEALIALQKMMTNNWEYLGEKTRKDMEGKTA